MTVEVKRSFTMLMSISDETYSAGLRGLTNMFRRFLDHMSSRNDTDMPCWLLNRISQRMSAPRKMSRTRDLPLPRGRRHEPPGEVQDGPVKTSMSRGMLLL
jgi:hypothetical protein